jgi:lipopolysaccharide cholinephosphotransferase
MKLCKDHNLRYYLIAGSLIGVFRHKGFIPWDDDIDVGMPRDDYDRFISVCKSVLPERYIISDHKTNHEWFFAFSQLFDTDAEIEIQMNELPRRCHVWIDIFPIDGLPKNSFKRWLHVKRIMLYRYMIQTSHIRTQVDTHKVGRPFYEKLILKILKIIPVGRLINSKKSLARLERCLKKYDFDSSKYVGNMLSKYRERDVVPVSHYGVPKYMSFENITVSVPAMSHELLTALYGDYMKLPPEKDRVSHDIKIIKSNERTD